MYTLKGHRFVNGECVPAEIRFAARYTSRVLLHYGCPYIDVHRSTGKI